MLGVGTLGGKEKLGSSPLSGGDGQNDSDEETKAPSPVGDELAKMAEDLTVDDENEDGEPVRRSPSGFSLSGLGSNAAVSPGGGRASMDDGKLDRH